MRYTESVCGSAGQRTAPRTNLDACTPVKYTIVPTQELPGPKQFCECFCTDLQPCDAKMSGSHLQQLQLATKPVATSTLFTTSCNHVGSQHCKQQLHSSCGSHTFSALAVGVQAQFLTGAKYRCLSHCMGLDCAA